ncbi:MAG: hypothetical protein ABI472_04050 [Ginsengibacter sp.]
MPSEASFGSKTGCDLPVDSHELIALCAPRLAFISYGVPEKGDANWLDHRGSYMAMIAAGIAFKLLGAKDPGVSNDYMKEKMPPVNTSLLDGQLAWRQHEGGHTDAPNFKYFIAWATRLLNNEKNRHSKKKISVKNLLAILLLNFIPAASTFVQTGNSRNGEKFAMVLTYDDGLNIDLTCAIPALDSVGLKGIFYKSIRPWK